MLQCWMRSLARLSNQTGTPAVQGSWVGLETVLHCQVRLLSRLPILVGLQPRYMIAVYGGKKKKKKLKEIVHKQLECQD